MSQQTGQHRFLSGRRRLLVITALGIVTAVAVGLVLVSQVPVAKECHRETLLPAEVRVSSPGSEVPEAVTRFAGVWVGALRPSGILGDIYQLGRVLIGRGRFALCHTLVVEEVYANGIARVIFSLGTDYADRNLHQPNFWYITGRIVNGELPLQLPIPVRHKLAYRVVGEALQATFEGPDGSIGATLTRVADLRQVGCGSQAGGLPPAQPAAGPRDRLTTAELLTGADAGGGPVHNAYFMPVGQAAPALHRKIPFVEETCATADRHVQYMDTGSCALPAAGGPAAHAWAQ